MRILVSLFVLALASPAMAAFDGPTTAGAGAGLVSAAEVQKLSDDTKVILEGNITHQVAHEDDDYVFADASGTVVVEIDNYIFGNQTITPTQKVRLTGEVDTNFVRDSTVDVKSLELVN